MRINKVTIVTIQDIAKLIGISVAQMEYFANNLRKHVVEYETPKKHRPTEKRIITAPSKDLKILLRAIKGYILDEYLYPDYTYGLGVKTLRQHAELHAGDKELVQVDIRDFYPSLNYKLVYKMWIDDFGFDARAARILTKLTSMDGGLKQGFPTSSHIAAIVAKSLTGELNDFCLLNNLRFSQYVDDLNISGADIDKRKLFKSIIPMARKVGLTIKKSKTTVRNTSNGKKITGVSLYGQRTRATKAVRQNAIQAMKAFRRSPSDKMMLRRVNGYLGFIRHLSRADGKKYAKMKKQNIASKKHDYK